VVNLDEFLIVKNKLRYGPCRNQTVGLAKLRKELQNEHIDNILPPASV
jgi:hypothetical protein